MADALPIFSPAYAPRIVIGVTTSQTCLILRGRLRALRLAGFHITVVSSPGPLLDRLAMSEGAEVVAIPIEREISLISDLLSLFRFWRMLVRVKPDMVEFSTPKAGLLGLLAARLCGVPKRIYLLRGLKLETAKGFKRRVLLAAERLASCCAHVVVCNSPSLREQAIGLGIAPASKLVLLGGGSSNGVDRFRFAPGPTLMRQQLGIPLDAQVIGFVGRLTRDKGVPELVEAFEHILAAVPTAYLLMVGWFDQSEDALTLALRRKIENHPRILVTGIVESTPAYYRAMDLEASATGIPVVTTMATGARDSVVPEVTGLVISPGYPEAITEAVLTLLADPERRARMGGAARSWVLENFVDTQVLGLVVKFYQGLIDENSSDRLQGSLIRS
jgi:glycosyltransferase involved in cell wall biosynthesis